MSDEKISVVEVSVTRSDLTSSTYYLELNSRALIFLLDVLQFLSLVEITDKHSGYGKPPLDKKIFQEYTVEQDESLAQT